MTSRILLTGGTGFIGGELAAARFAARGDEVVVVSRRGPRHAGTRVEAEVARADAVVHLAGEPIADARWTPERLERIRVEPRRHDGAPGARHRGRAAETARLRQRLGRRASTACAATTSCATRATPPGDDVLARLCVDWEAAAEPAETAGVRVVHPRIGIVLGQGGALAKMSGAFRWFVGGPLGSGHAVAQLGPRARRRARAAPRSRSRRPRRARSTSPRPTPVTMNDFARALGRSLGRPSAMRVPGARACASRSARGSPRCCSPGSARVPRRLEAAQFAFDFAAAGRAPCATCA